MINYICSSKGELTWHNDAIRYSLPLEGGSYVANSDVILLLNAAKNEVYVVNDKGSIIHKIHNTTEWKLKKLENHPIFGLSIVAIIRNSDGNWVERYFVFSENSFQIRKAG